MALLQLAIEGADDLILICQHFLEVIDCVLLAVLARVGAVILHLDDLLVFLLQELVQFLIFLHQYLKFFISLAVVSAVTFLQLMYLGAEQIVELVIFLDHDLELLPEIRCQLVFFDDNLAVLLQFLIHPLIFLDDNMYSFFDLVKGRFVFFCLQSLLL